MQKNCDNGQKRPFLGVFGLALRKGLRTSRKPESGFAQCLRSLSRMRLLPRVSLVAIWLMALSMTLFGNPARDPAALRFQFAFAGDRAVVMRDDGEAWQYFLSAADTPTFKRIPPAPGMFRPLRLIGGFAGHVYVQDAAQTRLCLYDTAGQWLSCRAYPEPLQNRRPDRVLVVARRDGRFVFVDQDRGKATLWREARQGDGQAAWQLLASVSVPANLDACLERPWFEGLCCLRQGKPVCYDAFLNAMPERAKTPDSALHAEPVHGSWQYRMGPPHLQLGSSPERSWVCFDSAQGLFACPPLGEGQ